MTTPAAENSSALSEAHHLAIQSGIYCPQSADGEVSSLASQICIDRTTVEQFIAAGKIVGLDFADPGTAPELFYQTPDGELAPAMNCDAVPDAARAECELMSAVAQMLKDHAAVVGQWRKLGGDIARGTLTDDRAAPVNRHSRLIGDLNDGGRPSCQRVRTLKALHPVVPAIPCEWPGELCATIIVCTTKTLAIASAGAIVAPTLRSLTDLASDFNYHQLHDAIAPVADPLARDRVYRSLEGPRLIVRVVKIPSESDGVPRDFQIESRPVGAWRWLHPTEAAQAKLVKGGWGAAIDATDLRTSAAVVNRLRVTHADRVVLGTIPTESLKSGGSLQLIRVGSSSSEGLVNVSMGEL